MAVKSVMWLRDLCKEIGLEQVGPTVLRGDNLTMVEQAGLAMNHERSRHYRIAQAFIHHAVEAGLVKIVHDSSENLEADINTKILARVKFIKFFQRISGYPQFLKKAGPTKQLTVGCYNGSLVVLVL